ncbi:MAG: hypothetical protein HYS64_05555, partial [Rhodospirillales bacterium]|nr:hypothetical protein [Rhodospirillales bacterium]
CDCAALRRPDPLLGDSAGADKDQVAADALYLACDRALDAAPNRHEADDGAHAPLLEHGEAPPTVVAPVVLTAAATVLFFLYPDVALGLARQVAGVSP